MPQHPEGHRQALSSARNASARTAWQFAPAVAVIPALLVALLTGFVPAWADTVRANTLVWGGSAFATVSVLAGWHFITARFSTLSISTVASISAVFGAFAGLIAAITSGSTADAGIRFVLAIAGAFQGAAVAWLMVGPDIDPVDTAHEPDGALEDEDQPTPPTSPP